MFGLKKKQVVDDNELNERWRDIDDRSRACYEDIEAIGAELRAAASMISAVPLQSVKDDDSVVTKATHLHNCTRSIAHTILFVDDDENNRKAFEYAFREEFRIYTAASGAEALKILDQQNIGVMVTDQKMPEMTGVELCKIVRRRFPNVVRMIISAYASTEAVIEACNEAQIRCFVRKPWEHERLVRMLNDALTPDAEATTIVG
jgi:CheY-like chemotaxis protein